MELIAENASVAPSSPKGMMHSTDYCCPVLASSAVVVAASQGPDGMAPQLGALNRLSVALVDILRLVFSVKKKKINK